MALSDFQNFLDPLGFAQWSSYILSFFIGEKPEMCRG